jgi:hypothetical protein
MLKRYADYRDTARGCQGEQRGDLKVEVSWI